MRTCAKKPCAAEADATVALRYEERVVVVHDLLPEPDPNLLEFCRVHADGLRVMVGWRLDDHRRPARPAGVHVVLS